MAKHIRCHKEATTWKFERKKNLFKFLNDGKKEKKIQNPIQSHNDKEWKKEPAKPWNHLPKAIHAFLVVF